MKPDKGKRKKSEQGALGDLISRGAGGPPIADSREVLNPARGQNKPAAKPDAPRPADPVVIEMSDDLAAAAKKTTETPAPAKTIPAGLAPTRTVHVPAAAARPQSVPASRWETIGLPSKRRTFVISPHTLLVVALFMSVLIHVTIGVVLSKAHIGAVDVSLLDQGERAFLVKLPTRDDPIYNDPVLTAAGFGLATQTNGAPGAPSATGRPTLGASDVSKMLLLNRTGPAVPSINGQGTTNPNTAGAGPAATAGPPGTITHPDVQPASARPALVDEAPKVDLPADILSNLASGTPVELPGVAAGNTALPGAASPGGNEGPSTASQARSLLKGMISSAGPTGSGINFGQGSAIPAAANPLVPDAAPGVDRRLLESLSTTPPIEVTAITLAEARTLDIPEKLDDDFDYLVTKFRPEIGGGLFQNAKADRYTYFRVDISAKRSLRKLKTMPKDLVFLIDTSGSVPQEWVNGMTRGVSDALGTLNEGDRFNILFFSEKTHLFSADKIQPATAATIAAAQKFLTGAKTGGDTDINRSLSQLLVRDTSAQRAYYLIFMSDGVPTRGVMDTRELINLVTRDNDLNASIYCVGVGSNQNKELLNFLAYRNKGFSVYSNNAAQTAGNIRDLMSRIRYPIIKDVGLNAIGLDFEEVFPHNLPNIHQGETFSVFGRYEIGGGFTMRVSGHNGIKGMDVTFGGDLSAARIGEKTIPEDWAFWKLHHIYSEIIRQGEKPELKAKIADLKQRFDLKTLY